jgi:spore germination protein GerM
MDQIGRKILFVLLGLAIAVAVFVLVARWGRMKKDQRPPVVREVPGETRTITVYYGSRDATGLVEETREITTGGGGLENEVAEAINALLEGPEDDEPVSAIPGGTRLLRAFWVEEEETVYLDFNGAITANHPGGSVSEYFTIKVILKTVSANFPQIKQVQLLVSGYPVETIAGHYGVSEPLDVREWR